jgi:hypothetical protein
MPNWKHCELHNEGRTQWGGNLGKLLQNQKVKTTRAKLRNKGERKEGQSKRVLKVKAREGKLCYWRGGHWKKKAWGK